MSDKDIKSSQPKVKISIVQKIGIFFLMPAFIVTTGLIIYDKQLADPGIIAATGFSIFIIFLIAAYLFIRRLVKKQYTTYKRMELMAITDDLTQLFTIKHFNDLSRVLICTGFL